MQIVRTVAEMRRVSRDVREGVGARVWGLVPTMGALHAGHTSLVKAAKAQCDVVVVSVFVNPLQFAPHEDFAQYPVTVDEDCRLLEQEGVDIVFSPRILEMYPEGAGTFVDVGSVGERLDGASRPGHFRGVATVVAKLFHIVGAHRAYFGQKDAAQVAVLRAMVLDLNFGVELMVCPTVRDADGLALSSRNRYLSAEERVRALALPRALRCVELAVREGERDAAKLRGILVAELPAEDVRLDYAEVVDADTLLPVSDVRKGALVAVAGWVGTTRLIDNAVIAAERGAR
ncbi:MAG: pantoate--beta-alanine ligase [Acidobacteriota bacterium]